MAKIEDCMPISNISTFWEPMHDKISPPSRFRNGAIGFDLSSTSESGFCPVTPVKDTVEPVIRIVLK